MQATAFGALPPEDGMPKPCPLYRPGFVIRPTPRHYGARIANLPPASR